MLNSSAWSDKRSHILVQWESKHGGEASCCWWMTLRERSFLLSRQFPLSWTRQLLVYQNLTVWHMLHPCFADKYVSPGCSLLWLTGWSLGETTDGISFTPIFGNEIFSVLELGGAGPRFALCPGGTHCGAKQQASGQTILSPEMESPADCGDWLLALAAVSVINMPRAAPRKGRVEAQNPSRGGCVSCF